MSSVRLGKTNIISLKNAFGALPIQRVSEEYASFLLNKAYDNGWTFFDTARAYSNSEYKVGIALSNVRDRITVATKTEAENIAQFKSDLAESLLNLKTDYIDIYQFHNPAKCPLPGDGTGLYEAMIEEKRKGTVRYIGITSHRLDVAKTAILSGMYDTLQFPFSYLASAEEIELVNMCKEHDIGFIAMKGMSGGLISNAACAYAFALGYPGVLPIWGIQRESEIDEFIRCEKEITELTDEMLTIIESDKKSLKGQFCRSCGYCMPCTAGIQIDQCARMSQLIRRAPEQNFLTESMKDMMSRINECIGCGICMTRCPYGLDIPKLLQENLKDYNNILKSKGEQK